MADEVYTVLLASFWPSILHLWSELKKLFLRLVVWHRLKVFKPFQPTSFICFSIASQLAVHLLLSQKFLIPPTVPQCKAKGVLYV